MDSGRSNSGNSRHLGDSHNFGRRVSCRDGRIVKPRTVVWEQMLLDGGSPLRRLFAEAAERDGLGRDAFAFLPDLTFHPATTLGTAGGGEVDEIELEPLGALSDSDLRALAAVVGRSLALWSWLGVSDLHWENLVLGRDARGRMIFTPLDVECIFDDLSLPTETKLLPDADEEYADICRHACGVRRVLPYLGKPVDGQNLAVMAAAYRDTLDFLDRHGGDIAAVFFRLPHLRETPIRVCLRGTDCYVEAQTEEVWPPLLPAEAEQLERGDIPYFFRLYGRSHIYYYTDETLATRGRIPSRGDVPRLDPLLSLENGLQSPNRASLREEGLFALLAAFDHPSLTGRYGSGNFEVTFGEDAIIVGLPSGEELECDRDLSAFVGSVYLPCSCGEVRSVFVPAVTECVKYDP